jgi:hypothetical protein
MNRIVPLVVFALALSGASAGASRRNAPAPPAPSEARQDFDAHWHDGRAELDGYRLTIERYGHPRVGRAVAIYVTEPFSRAKHVKLDDAAAHPEDVVDVLKLNLVRSFQTGIYDYHTMVSLFVRSQDFAPVKVAFTSAEWCGQVYEEAIFGEARMETRISSYFEGESSSGEVAVPAGGIEEDNLFILLRGLRGGFMKPGEKRTVPFLASPFYRRLAHRPLAWGPASIECLPVAETVRVPAGTFVTTAFVVRPGDGREGRFDIERAAPHRVVRWAWTAIAPADGRGHSVGGTDRGELTGTTRTQYWNRHDPGDEKDLRALGLGPAVR